MFDNIMNLFKKWNKNNTITAANNAKSKETAKERLHLVLMQDRANVSADFLELMKQEIIDVIKKYIDVDENAIDVRLTNKENGDGTNGAPALYANIPILNIKHETESVVSEKEKTKKLEKIEEPKTEKIKTKKENNEEQNENTKKSEELNKDEIKKSEDKKENKQQEKEETKKVKENKKEEKKDVKIKNKIQMRKINSEN